MSALRDHRLLVSARSSTGSTHFVHAASGCKGIRTPSTRLVVKAHCTVISIVADGARTQQISNRMPAFAAFEYLGRISSRRIVGILLEQSQLECCGTAEGSVVSSA